MLRLGLGVPRRPLLAAILGSATARYPLLGSLPSGSTFTRATVATIEDHEGLIRSCLSGEARFFGMRRVRNLMTASEGETASWSIYTNAGAFLVTSGYPDPDGGNTALWVRHNGVGTPTQVQMRQLLSNLAGRTIRPSAWIKATPGWGASAFQMRVLEDSAPFTSYGDLNIKATVNTTWQRIAGPVSAVTLNTATRVFDIYMEASAAQLAAGFYLWHPQSEDVTGQSNQAPSGYVSTGVLSSPYHGAFVDGVKYFDTENGNSVVSNIVTEATGSPIPYDTMRGFLREDQRRNYLTYSADFSNAAWTKVNVTISADAVASPDGGTSGDKLVASAGVAQHYVQSINISFTAGDYYTYSIYVKAAENSVVSVHFATAAFGVNAVIGIYDLGTGQATSSGSGGGLAVSMEDVGGGWYRCVATQQATATVVATAGYITFGSLSPFNGDGTSGFYVWGAQLETGMYSSSYIPTTSAAVTRNEDILYWPKAGVADETIGACYAEIMRPGVATISISTSYVMLEDEYGRAFYTPGGGTPTTISIYDGTTAASKTTIPSLQTGVRKCISSWGPTGGLRVTSSGLTPATAAFYGNMGGGGSTNIHVGHSGRANGFTIKNLAFWTIEPTIAEMQAATS